MFIKEIQLENFKCFENSTFQFEKQFTTIIGDNGSGKTALLDGIARGLTGIVDNLNKNGRFRNGLDDDEIRVISHKLGSQTTLEKLRKYNVKVVLNNNIFWDFIKTTNELDKYVFQLENAVGNGRPVDLPFIAYYKTSRHWSTEEYKNIEPYPIGSRLDTYNTCLNISTNYKTLLEWFSRMEWIRYKKRKEIPELEAVSNAIIKTLESLRPDKSKEISFAFSPENDELMVDIGDGKEFPIRMLSDGYRNTLGMIADIAYRMAELNPHLTTNSTGIVLIDELDLHLHPKWQRHIVGDLKRIFPNCQFIVTTHSPFIIQSLRSGELLKLDETPELEYDDFTKKGIEDITIEYQDLKDDKIRSADFEEMLKVAEEYYDLIEQGKTNGELAPLRQRLTELEEKYSEEPAFVAVLRAERKFKKI